MPDQKYNLNLEDAIEAMEGQLKILQEEGPHDQLVDIPSDVAFDLGYETAIFDLKSYTGPNPVEVELRIVQIPQEEESDDKSE